MRNILLPSLLLSLASQSFAATQVKPQKVDRNQVAQRLQSFIHAFGHAPTSVRNVLDSALVSFLARRNIPTTGRETFLDLLTKIIPHDGGLITPPNADAARTHGLTTVNAGHLELIEGASDVMGGRTPVLRLYEKPSRPVDYLLELSPGSFVLLAPTWVGSSNGDMLSFEWTPSTHLYPAHSSVHIEQDTRAEPYDYGWPQELNRGLSQGVLARLHELRGGLNPAEASVHENLVTGMERFLETKLPLDILSENALSHFVAEARMLTALGNPKFGRSTEQSRLGHPTATFGQAGEIFAGQETVVSLAGGWTRAVQPGENSHWLVGMAKPHGETWEFVFNGGRTGDEYDSQLTLKYSPPAKQGKVTLTRIHAVLPDWDD